MLGLLVKSIKDFKKSFSKYITFEFVYMLITGFIFVPIISYIFNRLLIALGSSTLLNNEVFKVVLDYKGILGLLLIATIAVIAVFIEFGVLIILSQKRFFSKDVSVSEAIYSSLKSIPRILGIGMVYLIILLLFLMPFIDSPLSPSLIEGLEIPLFIREVLFEFNYFIIVYFLGIAAIIYLFLRWIFTLHFIIIEGKTTRKAIKSSIALTENKRVLLLLKLLILNLTLGGIGFTIISTLALIPRFVGIGFNGFLENLLIAFSGFITYFFALLLTPLNIIFLTRLFYIEKEKQGQKIEDALIIYKNKPLSIIEERVKILFKRKRGLIYVLVAIYLSVSFLFTFYINDNFIFWGRRVAVAAHRGDPINAPENSMSSVRKALEQGADYIEIDVQVSKDGVVVLNHDIDLMRVAGVPYRIIDLTFEEISRLDVGRQFSSEFIGERIPTLEEVLLEVRGKARLIVEIKPYGPNYELAQAVLNVIEEYDMVEDCYIQSFDYSILQQVRRLNSDIKIGQIMYFALGKLSTINVDFYTVEKGMLSSNFIRSARRNKREVWVWTVNDERTIKEVLKYDIDGIITDYVERVKEIILIK